MINRYYICDSCNYQFIIQQPMHESLRKKCPKCGKMSLYQDLIGQHVYIQGEPKTVGQLADRNTKKLGKYALETEEQRRKTEHKRKKHEFAKKMGFEPKVADTKTWYNPNGEDLTKKLTHLDTPEKVNKYIKGGE